MGTNRGAARWAGQLLVAVASLQILAGGQEAIGQDFPDMFHNMFRDTPEDRELLENVPISAAEEEQFGRQMFDQTVAGLRRQGISVSDRGRDAQYLQRLTSELRPRMTHARRYRAIQVWVADTDLTDARSFPGGRILVSRGLLDFAESEAAMVGVLAHELSHIDRGHQLELPRRFKLAQQTVTADNFQPEQFFQSGKLFAGFFARPFRPEQETEADADAVRWTMANRYDALELAHFFQRLQQRDGAAPANVPSFLRSHPLPADRERAVQQLVDPLRGPQRGEVEYRGRENLRRRLPRSRRQFAE